MLKVDPGTYMGVNQSFHTTLAQWNKIYKMSSDGIVIIIIVVIIIRVKHWEYESKRFLESYVWRNIGARDLEWHKEWI